MILPYCFIDIETDGVITKDADGDVKYPNIAYIGVLDENGNTHLFDRDQLDDAAEYFSETPIALYIGFNSHDFDIPILQHHGILPKSIKWWDAPDLYQICKVKGKLQALGYRPDNFKLRTIAELLKLPSLKGDINYDVFKKKKWTKKERAEIERYLIADLKTTSALWDHLDVAFAPLKQFLPKKKLMRAEHITSSPAALSYQSICNMSGVKPEYRDEKEIEKIEHVSFEGGHHLEPREQKVVGDLYSFDFASAYPHAILSHNLLSRVDGKGSAGYYSLSGKYETYEQGRMEAALSKILRMRLEAKKKGDKRLNACLKLIINSFYGTLGNTCFKKTYDPVAASDCTSITRTWLRKVAARLEAAGCRVVYGFTDSVYVCKPKHMSEAALGWIIKDEISLAMRNCPFPQETFTMDCEDKYKLFFISSLNHYLRVTKDGEVLLKGSFKGLHDKNTPPIVSKVWEEFCVPYIRDKLDVAFDKNTIIGELCRRAQDDIMLCAKRYSVKDVSSYKLETQQQAKISSCYGEGEHFLIPNIRGCGALNERTAHKRGFVLLQTSINTV